MSKKKYLPASVLVLPFLLLLTGCDINGLLADSSEQSTTRSSKTSEEGVADGLLPKWVPKGGTNAELVQRNSGSERIFVMDYAGDLPAKACKPLGTVGEPTKTELANAYASDDRIKSFDPEEISDTRTLEASWWPEGTELRTTHLCERFWVQQSDGKLYAFAPDTIDTVTNVQKEREARNSQ